MKIPIIMEWYVKIVLFLIVMHIQICATAAESVETGPESSQIEVIQQRVITGTVVDENGVPLAGTSVSEKGTANGAKTDSAGYFSLNVQGMEATLVVSYVGYTPQEIPLKTKLRNFMHIVNVKLAKWARSKYKHLRSSEMKAIRWLHGISRKNPGLLAHWRLNAVPSVN